MVLRNVGHMEKVWIIHSMECFPSHWGAFQGSENSPRFSRADKEEILLSCDPYNWMISRENIAKQWTYAVWIFKGVSCKASQIASMTNRPHEWRWQNDLMTENCRASHPCLKSFPHFCIPTKAETEQRKIEMHNSGGWIFVFLRRADAGDPTSLFNGTVSDAHPLNSPAMVSNCWEKNVSKSILLFVFVFYPRCSR